jgi:hypothetical protein
MALTATDKKEIETLIRKEIKDFIGQTTVKQFETKMIDEFKKELRRNGKLEGEVKELVLKMLTEFYGFLYQQRSQWQSRVKNV